MTKPQSLFVIRRGRSGSTEQRVTSSLLIPCVIDCSANGIEGPHEVEERVVVCLEVNRRPAFPLVDFGVAIGKRKPAGAAVEGGGQIAPTVRVNRHNEKAVVDRVG